MNDNVSDKVTFEGFHFVLCPSYHGATLLSCLLNNHSLVTSMGDTVPAEKFIIGDVHCGCGDLIRECEFWKSVINKSNPDGIYRDGHLLPVYPKVISNQRVNKNIVKAIGLISLYSTGQIWKVIGSSTNHYIDSYIQYYKLICNLQNTSYFIDGQKSLIKILAFSGVFNKNQPMKILQLYRDPRAVYYSYIRRNRDVTVKDFCRAWKRYHNRVNQLHRKRNQFSVFPLRYETFCENPQGKMDEIQEFFCIPRESLVRQSSLKDMKHVIGNKMISIFDGTVRYDSKWRDELPLSTQKLVISMTEPLFSKAGYIE